MFRSSAAKVPSALYRLPAVLFAGCAALFYLSGCGLLPGGPGSCDDPAWTPTHGEEQPAVKLRDRSAPLHIVRFDQDGRICKASSLDAILAAIKEKSPTHVYVLCPGWTSNWSESAGWMASFLTGFESIRMRALPDAAQGRPYRPLYIGVVWPSDVLVEAFEAPSMSGGRRIVRADADSQALTDTLSIDPLPARLDRIRAALKAQGHAVRAKQLDRLLAHEATLTPPELVDLANCLLPLYGPQEEAWAPGPRFAETLGMPPVGRIRESEAVGLLEQSPAPLAPIDPQELLETWKRAVREAAADKPHAAERPGEDQSLARQHGLSVIELVRWALKASDLRLMKDRAYRVGRNGLGELLDSVNAARGTASVHLVGHSLGCEALLEALSRGGMTPSTAPSTMPATGGLADSLLLLEPLVSSWAFAQPPAVGADVIPELQKFSHAGGYRPAITGAVRGTVVVTRSAHDWVTSYYAPKALRRPPLEGHANPDTWAGDGNGWKVMGGGGALGTEPPAVTVPLIPLTPGLPIQLYVWPADTKLIVIDATPAILTHSDVNDPTLWWLMANQVVPAK